MFASEPTVSVSEYRDREQAEIHIGQTTRSRVQFDPNPGSRFGLDMRFSVNHATVGFEYAYHNGGRTRYEDEVRCIGIFANRKGCGGVVRKNEDVPVEKDEVLVFDTWRANGFFAGDHSNARLMFLSFNHIVDIAGVYIDRPIKDDWHWMTYLDKDARARLGLLSLVDALSHSIELCSENNYAVKRSLQLCEEALIMYLFSHTALFTSAADQGMVALPSNRQVKKALDIIKSGEDISAVSDLASRLGISVRALQDAFRKHAGESPYAVIRRERLRKVRSAIDRGEIQSVKQLQQRFLISNIARFNRDFRDLFGETPLENIRRAHGAALRNVVSHQVV